MKPVHFIAGIFASLLLAFLIPAPGAPNGFLYPSILAPVATFLIFFIQGLQLKDGAFAGIRNQWRLHCACQSANFIIAPLVFCGLTVVFGAFLRDESIILGIIFLGILPTTINSAITMVSMSNGNVASAIFNSCLSNIVGVFFVPAFLTFYTRSMDSISVNFLPIILKLIWLVVLPVILGRLIRSNSLLAPRIPSSSFLKNLSMYLIFLIVYFAFCRSVQSESWEALNVREFVSVLVIVLIGLSAVHTIVWFTGKWYKLDRDSLPVYLFCGAQKTLAAGVPLGLTIVSQISGSVDASIFLIPIMIYHPIQMLVGGRWIHVLSQSDEVGKAS